MLLQFNVIIVQVFIGESNISEQNVSFSKMGSLYSKKPLNHYKYIFSTNDSLNKKYIFIILNGVLISKRLIFISLCVIFHTIQDTQYTIHMSLIHIINFYSL